MLRKIRQKGKQNYEERNEREKRIKEGKGNRR